MSVETWFSNQTHLQKIIWWTNKEHDYSIV